MTRHNANLPTQVAGAEAAPLCPPHSPKASRVSARLGTSPSSDTLLDPMSPQQLAVCFEAWFQPCDDVDWPIEDVEPANKAATNLLP